MPLDTLCKLEDESYLNAKAAERAAAKKAQARKKKRRILALSALGIAILAIIAFLAIQPQMAHQALPSCYAPSSMTIYNEDGEPYATWLYTVNEQGAPSEIQGATTTTVHLEDYNAGTTSSGSPINARYVASLSPNEAGFPLSMTSRQWIEEDGLSNEGSETSSTAEASVSETGENGLPLKATVALGSGETYRYQFAYHSDGALKSISFETANYSTSATYNEHGFPQEDTTSTSDGMSVTTYSYSEEGSPMPASCAVHTEDAEGNSTDQTFSYEYDENGNLYRLSIDGVLRYEFAYANIDHASPWTYAIASTKPFCGVLHGMTY